MPFQPLPRDVSARVSWPSPIVSPPVVPFNPSTASQDALLERGFPLRPDPKVSPALFSFWQRMTAPPYRLVEVPVFAQDSETGHSFGSMDSGMIAGPGASRWGTSENWSGMTLAARDGMRFTSVAASWIVPSVEGVKGDTTAKLAGGNRQMSVWIGLDGHRDYSVSLPQIGTRSMATPLGNDQFDTSYHLWVQWWVRDELFGEIPVTNFTVGAGHELFVKMDVLSATAIRFTVRNRTTNLALAATWLAGAYEGTLSGALDTAPAAAFDATYSPDLIRAKAPVEGRHAVWCVERPSVLPQGQLSKQQALKLIKPYDLPVFKEATFREALAELRAADGTVQECNSRAARYIRMIARGVDQQAGPVVHHVASPVAPPRGQSWTKVEQARV
jgi:hypothetical protein